MLTQRVDLFDSTYGHFTEDVLATIRVVRRVREATVHASDALVRRDG